MIRSIWVGVSRIGDEYYAFVDMVIEAVKRRWPKALIQFEDFAKCDATFRKISR